MSSLYVPAAVGCGGFIGALTRFYVSAWIGRASGEDFLFVGTMAVNLAGCFFIGVLAFTIGHTTAFSPTMQKLLITGLLGSLTTFSTFAFESLQLLQSQRYGAAVANVGINLFAGLVLVWLGMLTAQTVLGDSAIDSGI